MMRNALLFFIAVLRLSVYGQETRFEMPLKGVAGKDFFIDYYVDHDSTTGIRDPYCGSVTYDGHRGTDMLLRDFKKMDSGVYVYAAAGGRVVEVKDGVYDRSKHWVSGGLGNHIKVQLPNSMYTLYGHLMKNSLMVKTGDVVHTGQPLGKVGSSGYSCYAHLHFEVRDSNYKVVDPFTGNCSPTKQSLWAVQPRYDTGLYLIEDGFVPYRPGIDTLKEGYLVKDTFIKNADTMVCYWALVHGLKKDFKIHAEWQAPDGTIWHEYDWVWKEHWWHDYTWTYIRMPKMKGRWRASIFVNGALLSSRNFYVVK